MSALKFPRRAFTRYGLPIIAIAALLFMVKSLAGQPAREQMTPTFAPAASTYNAQVGATGMVEPASETIAIGTNIAGIVEKVHVQAGTQIKQGAPLFTIDTRDAQARLAQAKARLQSSRIAAADATHQYQLYANVRDKRAISRDALTQRRYAMELANARVKETLAEIEAIQTELSRLVVRAPSDGEVLRVDVRVGEYAPVGVLATPLIRFGDTSRLHVRVQIDESDAPRFRTEAKATANLRGKGDARMPLEFVRVEPFVTPKRNLSNDTNERVDTRVMEVIYAMGEGAEAARIGQQVDVFIEASDAK